MPLHYKVITTALDDSIFLDYYKHTCYSNCWASEASPILGCSIEMSHDIYICMYVYMSSIVYGKTIQKNHMLKCLGRIT